MTKKSPFAVIKSKRVTEKSRVLENLKHAKSNPSIARFLSAKYVFDVDISANKQEIAQAIEEIYSDKKIQVQKVNTVSIKPKQRRVRGHLGMTARGKKAIVTLKEGQSLDEQV